MPANPTATSQRSTGAALWHLAWPIWVSQLATMGSSVIDTAMAGRLSSLDLAAVGIASSVQASLMFSLMGVLYALPPLVASLHGAGRQREIGAQVHQSLWVAAALALLVMVAMRRPGWLLSLSHLQPDVELKVRAYLNAASWGMPAAFALRLFIGLASGIGRPRPVMVFNLLSLLVKWPLNALFMYGAVGVPALGAVGCAVASTVDAWLMAALAWSWCVRQPHYRPFQLGLPLAKPDWAAIAAFLRMGLPIGLTYLADVTAFTLMAVFIARLGPSMSAAHQIAANLAVIAYMLPLALGNATAILVGQSIGAGQPQQAQRSAWLGVRTGFVAALAVSACMYFGASRIAALYTTDLQVQALAAPLIAWVALYHVFDALQVTTVTALRGYQKTLWPMLVYAVALWGLGLGGGIALGLGNGLGAPHGAAGFWQAGTLALVVIAALMLVYLRRTGRGTMRACNPGRFD